MSDDSRRIASASSWAAPGVAFLAPEDGLPADVLALGRAVDEALAVVPAGLTPGTAMARAEGLLAVQERITAVALQAVGDVDARQLWQLRQAGSTQTWLRTLPCGNRGQLALARLLAARPVLTEALGAGDLSVRTAAAVARELARVPAFVDPEQLEGVLVDGVGDLLAVWAGAACLEPTPAEEAVFEQRRLLLAAAVRAGLADCWSGPAGKLEPAFVLAARVLAPDEVAPGLRLLVDALQPEAAADERDEREYRSRSLVLRKLPEGGWSLRALLGDEVGQQLYDAMQVRDAGHPVQKARATRASKPGSDGLTDEDVLAGREVAPADDADADAGQEANAADLDVDCAEADTAVADMDTAAADMDLEADGDEANADEVDDTAADDADEERYGAAGAGSPVTPWGPDVEGTPIDSKEQRAHDAFAQLLADLTAVPPGSDIPAPAHLTIIAPVEALEGNPGARPGRLVTDKGDVPLSPRRLRKLACGTVLAAVLRDALGRPVGASGTHRHATRRERRAMRAAWGSGCAVNGCTLPGVIPHHAEPFWKALVTALKDLVPLCEHHHHDIHDGHSRLRLRDGRLLDEWGWALSA